MFKAGDARDSMTLATRNLAKGRILEKWSIDRPPVKGIEFDEWVDAEAAELDVKRDFILKALDEGAESFIHAANVAMMPAAQRIANLYGATLEKAMITLRDGMDAVRVHVTKDGTPIEVADTPSRIAAVKEVLKVHGAYAPEKTEIYSQTLNVTATIDQLREESEFIQRELQRIGRGKATSATAAGDQPPVEVPTGVEGQVLLVDAMHGDGRQPGQPESVQAVPAAELHEAAARPARRRARRPN